MSGRPNRNSLSKRPGRRRAGSMESSLFVAPITTISPRPSNPSIRASRVDTIELQKFKNKFVIIYIHRKRVKVKYVYLRTIKTCESDLVCWIEQEPSHQSHQRRWWRDVSDTPKEWTKVEHYFDVMYFFFISKTDDIVESLYFLNLFFQPFLQPATRGQRSNIR